MPTLTIRNLPAVVVNRIKKSAKLKGVSMEQEVREILETRYGSRDAVLAGIRRRWSELPPARAGEIERWRSVDKR